MRAIWHMAPKCRIDLNKKLKFKLLVKERPVMQLFGQIYYLYNPEYLIMRKLFLFIPVLLMVGFVKGQDPHFSQFLLHH